MSLLLMNGNIINVENGEVNKGSIFIQNGRIVQVGQGLVDADEVIDLNGKFVIPGLIDMHCHIKEGFANFFTAAGVTTVRNTGGNVIELKDLIHASIDAPTPRVYSTDRIIDGTPGLWGDSSPWNLNTESIEEARAEVRRQVKKGAQFIKVYCLLAPNVMKAVVDESHEHGLEVSCDLIHSNQVNALDAAKMGVKWFEHNSGFIQAMYPDWSTRADQTVWDQIDWENPNLDNVRNICEQMIEYDAILCPTTVIHDQVNKIPNYWKPENKFYNESLNRQWEQVSQHAEALKQQLGIQTNYIKAITNVYNDLGGTIVAGTDTPAGMWTFPGMALHRELELLVKSGLSELRALQAATITAAQSIQLNEIGSVQEGKIADLLVLEENPLENILNTRQIHSIIKGGKLFNQQELLEKTPNEAEITKKLEEFMEKFEKQTN